MRRANRKDTIHAAIVQGLRQHGISVCDMPDPGDILCYGQHADGRYLWVPMELKSDQRTRGYKPEATELQAERATIKDRWYRGADGKKYKDTTNAIKVPVVHSLAEGLALFGRSSE